MTDSDERRKMALQINPNIGTPATSGDVNAQPTTGPNGTPNQDAANQLADLLKNPAEGTGKPTQAPSPFGSPFKTAQTPDKPGTQNAPSPFGTPAKSEGKTTSDAKPDSPTTSIEQGSSTSKGTEEGAEEGTTANTASPFTTQAKLDTKSSVDTKGASFASSATAPTDIGVTSSMNLGSSASPTTAAQSAPTSIGAKADASSSSPAAFTAQANVATNATSTTSSPNTPTSNMSNTSMSANTAGIGAPTQSQSGISGEIKESARPGSEFLSDAQLAAAASMNAALGVQPSGGTVSSAGVEEVAQPHVDGEKIEAMMKSVTKELGMRDLSNLKLGGEMTLKLDQGALPNTEVKVRFEGNEMVISIDSKTADVNKFCTDNFSLLQQSVSSGMKEDMKVRIEVRNPPDQPNQRKDGESGGSGQGGQSGGGQESNQGKSQQSQASEGDSLSS
jgi:hypothetical protein